MPIPPSLTEMSLTARLPLSKLRATLDTRAFCASIRCCDIGVALFGSLHAMFEVTYAIYYSFLRFALNWGFSALSNSYP